MGKFPFKGRPHERPGPIRHADPLFAFAADHAAAVLQQPGRLRALVQCDGPITTEARAGSYTKKIILRNKPV